MATKATARNAVMFVGGIAIAGAGVLLTSAPTARAAAGGGRALQVQKINVAQGSGVPANSVIEITMSQPVNPASVTPATVQVRGKHPTAPVYTKQVVGSFQVVGNVIRFYPRLPTHLRDATGKFYSQGSPLDDASANAGLKPTTDYEIRLIGKPAVTTVQSNKGRPLKNTNYTRFSTAAASPPDKLWTTQSYTDSPPPQFSFSNPPDTVPAAATQYTTHGGTKDVPSSIVMSLFCTKVPLAPGTARNEGNVTLTRIARKDDYSLRRPIVGSVFIEQNFDTTLLAFQPKVALVDLATFSLRVSKGVKDLTEQNDFAPNRERDQLRQIYDFLAAARTLSPGVPPAQFPDPPLQLITDWPKLTDEQGLPIPGAVAARGVLKANILTLGDTYPDEVDPRAMLIFTSRDEPGTKDSLTVEFLKSENIYDSSLSTGDLDTVLNPSSAVATFTISGGSGVLGDFAPAIATTISSDLQPGNTFNYRNFSIPANVIVTVTGTKPATVLAATVVINGELRADGAPGKDADPNASGTAIISTNSPTPAAGGVGGPGGGAGGIGLNTVTPVGQQAGTGVVGNDSLGVLASATNGGRGGTGGFHGATTVYTYGGGGGGGGARTAGTAGAKGTYTTASWNGNAGVGGAAALGNADLSTLVGGAGGGAGGSGATQYYNWGSAGGSGGGGGGALVVQTAGVLTVGANGAIRARGGKGGNGCGVKSNWAPGPGGGGGGGSILLRSSKGFNVADYTKAIDVSGGAGGGQVGTAGVSAASGGVGGLGFYRIESPTGGVLVPPGTAGTYQPVGGGVPSFVYTKWIDLGVQDPKIYAWDAGSIVTVPQNDAIYVQAQMTTEHPTIYATPNLNAITSTQDSNNIAIMSQWQPLKLHDLSGIVGGAFTKTLGAIPGLPPNPPTEYAGFSAAPFNGKGYRFIRFRIYFQLDSTQTSSDPMPYVDKIVTTFEFNF